MSTIRDDYLRTLIGMATDTLLGRGPSPRALISNLRIVADHLEEMLPADCDEEGRGK